MAGNVKFTRTDYKQLRKQWEVIEDCLDGEVRIKERVDLYLPRPNATDKTAGNILRYDNYIKRAVFYNVTRRTINGLVGLVFQREPEIELPSSMDTMEDNADGGGVNLVQIAKDTLFMSVAYGKCGILVDYPHADEPITIAMAKQQGIGPTLTAYHPKNIINWRDAVIGGKKKLTLVVLEESEMLTQLGDEFAMEFKPQYRVLRLTDGVYTQQVYTNDGANPGPVVTPTDANGNSFDEIPFFPIGSETNTMKPTSPPAYDLATINIAHYCNSADYEESIFTVGQPTLVLTGLTQEWVKDMFSEGVVEVGSRAAISMPVGGDAKMLQAEPNMIAKEGMEAKEAQMVALGARLVKNDTTEKTATQSTYDQSNADSTLINCAQNVNDGVNEALKFAARFTGASDGEIVFKLNTEFDLTKLTAEDIKNVIAAWQANAIVTSEMRHTLQRAGIATLDADEYEKELEDDMQRTLENTADMTVAQTPPPEPKVA